MFRQFFKYVSQNMLGMVGMSLYILADTFFISRAVGADGITALNLVLPIYNLIFAIGAMIGVGSAIRYSIEKNKNKAEADGYFTHSLIWATIISLIFVLAGIFIPDKIIAFLGGDNNIVEAGTTYTRIFMTFAPFFMWNHICNAFVRNDGNPSVAMAATLLSSLFNIVFDYVLMFPLGLSMAGAAFATALSPIVGVLICCVHFFSAKSGIRLRKIRPSFKKLIFSCQVGISAFVGELSQGVITVVFNIIILSLCGNVGVAAYCVVANVSLVAVALFNGIAQGSQPLISNCYGRGERKSTRELARMALFTAFILSVIIIAVMYVWTEPIAGIFNRDNDSLLAEYAMEGLRIYFVGFLFAGLNIVGTAALSAVESVKWAFAASVVRGFIAIIVFVVILSAALGMTGVWLAFPAAELLTMFITLTGVRKAEL